MTTFSEWWVAEVGHPPADDKERYAFRLAQRAFLHGTRQGLRRARVCEECGEPITEPTVVADRTLCVPCGAHACEVCGAVDSETINGMDRCLEHTEEK